MAATLSKAAREITRAYRDVDARGSVGVIWLRRLRNAIAGLKLLFYLIFAFNGCFVINEREFWKTLMKKLRYAKLYEQENEENEHKKIYILDLGHCHYRLTPIWWSQTLRLLKLSFFLSMHLLPQVNVMLNFIWTLPVQLRGTRNGHHCQVPVTGF